MLLFYLESVNQMRQVPITISEFTHSIKKPRGRCEIKFIWQFTPLSFQILLNFYWKMWKTVVQAYKILKSFSKRRWGSAKEILLICCFSLPDDSFTVIRFIFVNFDWGREVYYFMDLIKGDEGADTDLMFQFCLPKFWIFKFFEQELWKW